MEGGVERRDLGQARPNGHRRADRSHRLVEDPLAFDRFVVALTQTVDMHGPCEVGAGLEVVQLLLQQQGVGAKVDKALAPDQLGGDHMDLRVNEGLTAGD